MDKEKKYCITTDWETGCTILVTKERYEEYMKNIWDTAKPTFTKEESSNIGKIIIFGTGGDINK